MTEADWLTATDPQPMLEFLRGKVSDRKLRHLMVSPVMLVLEKSAERNWRRTVDVLDRFVAAEISRRELDRSLLARSSRCSTFDHNGFPWGSERPHNSLYDDVESAVVWYFRFFLPPEIIVYGESMVWQAAQESLPTSPIRTAVERIVGTIRDIVGNPFRPIPFNPAWRSETVLALATGIYAERAFDRLPILADALEEAGCDQPDILNHCRGPGPHVRGCWAVDLVLGKE